MTLTATGVMHTDTPAPASETPALDWLRANTEVLTGPVDDIDSPAVIDLTDDGRADYEDWGIDSDE